MLVFVRKVTNRKKEIVRVLVTHAIGWITCSSRNVIPIPVPRTEERNITHYYPQLTNRTGLKWLKDPIELAPEIS